MPYLYLTFKDARLHQTLNSFGGLDKKADDNANAIEIIGVNQLSNVLHVLMGLPPSASKRKTIFKHNPEIYNIVKTAKIKYKNNFGIDSNGVFNGIEFGSAFKPAYNSHQKLTTIFNIDGKQTIIKGYWNWNSLKKAMYDGKGKKSNTPNRYHFWDDFYHFLCTYFNTDDLINKMSLYELIKIISKNNYSDIKPYIEKLNEEGGFSGCCDVYKLFSGSELSSINCSNTCFSSQQPMLNNNGIRSYKPFSGEIVVEIPQDFIPLLEENEGYCTILDGGLVSIDRIENKGINIYDGYQNI